MSFKLDNNGHLKECDAYGGFDCDCQERVERAIIGWARDHMTFHMTKDDPAYEPLHELFELLYNKEWS